MTVKPLVCVIDDDNLVRQTIVTALEGAGFPTVQARDGMLGLKEIASSGARVAVVDMIMPNQEGLETVSEAKRRFPDIKILAVSGGWASMAADALLALAKELGADDVLPKPFHNADLVAKITRLATPAP